VLQFTMHVSYKVLSKEKVCVHKYILILEIPLTLHFFGSWDSICNEYNLYEHANCISYDGCFDARRHHQTDREVLNSDTLWDSIAVCPYLEPYSLSLQDLSTHLKYRHNINDESTIRQPYISRNRGFKWSE